MTISLAQCWSALKRCPIINHIVTNKRKTKKKKKNEKKSKTKNLKPGTTFGSGSSLFPHQKKRCPNRPFFGRRGQIQESPKPNCQPWSNMPGSSSSRPGGQRAETFSQSLPLFGASCSASQHQSTFSNTTKVDCVNNRSHADWRSRTNGTRPEAADGHL